MSEKQFKIINELGDYHLLDGDEELCYDLCSPAMAKENWNNVVDRLNEQQETISDLIGLDEESEIEIKHINNIYKELGFDGVIEYAKQRLSCCGAVREVETGLWLMATGGWSDNEHWLHCLNNWTCMFSYRHYRGCTSGGGFYYAKEPFTTVKMVIEER